LQRDAIDSPCADPERRRADLIELADFLVGGEDEAVRRDRLVFVLMAIRDVVQ